MTPGDEGPRGGTLRGIRVVELGGIGPAPMAGMMLADMGADVVLVERSPERSALWVKDPSLRGKRSLGLNLKSEQGVSVFLKLIERADVLIEGFRPGVTERLGIGPQPCLARNPRLIYGRMTGWGQDGPLAGAAGHDINYISIAGALHGVGRPGERPVPPLNLFGDMGGGAMLLTVGVLAALVERATSGQGQVIDAAMVDGTALQMWLLRGLHASGHWNAAERGVNLLDGGAHFYDTYETRDGRYVAIGPIEPQFYAELCRRLGLDPDRFADQMNARRWPDMKSELADIFKTRTRSEWCELLEGTDACFAPVLSMTEAPQHPHNMARHAYTDIDGFTQPAPAPRFGRTPSAVAHGARAPGQDTAAVLRELGLADAEVEALLRAGVAFDERAT